MSEYVMVPLFEGVYIRRAWHDDRWFFAVVDVIALLTESKNPRQYWYTLKKRLLDEGAGETLTERREKPPAFKRGMKAPSPPRPSSCFLAFPFGFVLYCDHA